MHRLISLGLQEYPEVEADALLRRLECIEPGPRLQTSDVTVKGDRLYWAKRIFQ
jgi:hypothetical protein